MWKNRVAVIKYFLNMFKTSFSISLKFASLDSKRTYPLYNLSNAFLKNLPEVFLLVSDHQKIWLSPQSEKF